MCDTNGIKELYQHVDKELSSVMSFWLTHSHDKENGGFFNCLYEDGRVYDELKYCWLQSRQVWMYCRLYNEVDRYHKQEILDVAIHGAEFLNKCVKRDDNRCYFIVTAEGKPVKLQRTIFSECFYVMAMAEVARATGKDAYQFEACAVLESILEWIIDGNLPHGHPSFEGAPQTNTLSVPMMVFHIVSEVCTNFPDLKQKYSHWKEWAVDKILQHLQRIGQVVLENISEEGNELPGSSGRLINPGHTIEAGWFLLQHAVEIGNDELKKTAIEKFILLPFKLGWDKQFEGLYYFQDVDNFSPVQLEWNMKLWWPHCEALVAFLLAYKTTDNIQFLDNFKKVFRYCTVKFSDPEYGEWYGYLSEKGSVTHNFKGGPFKGCFHIPRCLYMCRKILREMIAKSDDYNNELVTDFSGNT